MENRIKETALEEAEKIKHLTVEAVKSRAYLYPLKVFHFGSHGLINDFYVIVTVRKGNLLLHCPPKSMETLHI